MRAGWIAVAVLAACMVGQPSCAADLSDGVSRIARDARREGRDFKFSALIAPAPSLKLTLGLAYDKDEADARTTNAPFDLNYQTPGDAWWKFQVKGDGYTRVTAPGVPATSGLADLKFNVAHPLSSAFIGLAGFTLPTGGDIGSQRATTHGTLVYSGELSGNWSTVAFADVKRYDGASAGQSSYRQSLYAEFDYQLDASQWLSLSALRTHRGGSGGVTELGAGYAFPLMGSMTGSFSIARGITRDARHTGAEIDVTMKF
jgi:hypothetical protein